MDANQCWWMCDLQRLSRTTFLHLSVPLSSKRQLNCWWHCLFCKSVAGHLCEFHTKQWGKHCSVPVSCLPHTSLQLIVCKSAVNCLKSWRVVLLSQDWQGEGAFARTHTSSLACTSRIWLLYWLGTCVNFIPNSEGSLSLFLLVVCPTLFCNRRSAGVQSIVWRAEGRHCFHMIGGGKAPSHAPILCLLLVLLWFGCCIGWALVWISYRTVSGALLCSCRLFAPHFSAIDSLQAGVQLIVSRAEGQHCFCRIGSGKAPSHAP
jgi:hypothetical protein